MKRKTHKDFCDEVFEQVGDEYTVKSTYINIKTHVLMKHEICEYEWDILPINFLKKKSRCPLCAGNAKITIDDFIKKLEEKYFGNAKLISDFNGIKNDVKIKFINCGHEHIIKAMNLLYKTNHGCNVCNSNEKKTHDQFCKEVYDLVGDDYIVLTEYDGNKKHITMKHNICNNEYLVAPSEFLVGKRCPKCQHRSYLKTTEEFRYLI